MAVAEILQTVEPLFPYRLMELSVTKGAARVVISVDTTGKLTEWLVVGYTQPEFADAAVAAIKQWQFEPARLHGIPVGTISELSFNFSARGVVISQSVADFIEARTLQLFAGRYAFEPCLPAELDRRPEPDRHRRPGLSQTARGQGRARAGDGRVLHRPDRSGAPPVGVEPGQRGIGRAGSDGHEPVEVHAADLKGAECVGEGRAGI